MQVVVAKSDRDLRWVRRNPNWVSAGNKTNNRPRIVLKNNTLRVQKISAADQAEVDRLLSNQSRLTAQVRTAFLDAIARLQDQVDLERIRQLLEQGQVDQAISSVNTQLVLQGMTPIAQASSAGAVFAAQQAALALPELGLGHLNISFGITNPQTIEYLRTYEMGLIRGFTQDAVQSVRMAIETGVRAGRNPLDIARDVRAFIGLTPQQTQAVINYRAGLENLSSGVLDRALRDARFDPTISSAIDAGTQLSQDYIDRATARYAERYLKYRSETIARTEAIRAVNAGNHQLWQQAATDGKVQADQVTREWVYTKDSKTRAAHRAIPSMNPGGVGLNEPFQTPDGPLLFPGDPNGPPQAVINCRCAVFMRYRPKTKQAA